jgi:hypothetical protein
MIQYKQAIKKHVSWTIIKIAKSPWGEIETNEK